MRKMLRFTLFISLLAIVVGQNARDEVIQITFPTDGAIINNDTVDVLFNLADFFQIGSDQTSDGYVKVFLNGTEHGSVTSGNSYQLPDLLDGEYFLKTEAVNPSGQSFDPETSDTVTFFVDWQENLCPPTGFEVSSTTIYSSLVLNWAEPTGSGGGSFEDFYEDFESGSIPENWTMTTNSLVGGWYVTLEGSSSFFNIPPGDGYYCVSNDDAANDVGSVDFLITPGLDISGLNSIFLEYYSFFNGTYGQSAYVKVSLDDGATFTQIDELEGSNLWINEVVDLSSYAGESNLKIAFHSDDNGGWASGWALDNIVVTAEAPDTRTVYTYTLTEFGWDMKTLTKENLIEKYPAERGPYSIVDESGIVENTVTLRDLIPTCGNLQGYDIYRDGSVIAAAVDTNYYADDNVTLGTEYCYYVKAVYESSDGSTAYSDTSNNACGTSEEFVANPPTNLRGTALEEEAYLAWTAPGTQTYVFYEDFANGIPADWTVVNLNDDEYTWSSPHANSNGVHSGFGDALYAICDSDDAPSSVAMDEELITASLNFSSVSTPYLSFLTYYEDLTAGDGTDFAALDVSTDGGTTWTNMFTWDSDVGSATAPSTEVVDLTAAAGGSSDVKIRFHYNDNNTWAWHWAIDDIIIYDSNPAGDSLNAPRVTDGDFLHYQVVSGGSVIADTISGTSTTVTGLTNGVTYTLGVTALYYPNYYSDTIETTLTPTWMYGDIEGTVYGPDGMSALDSAVVAVGTLRDTTGTDGTYLFEGLDPGTYSVKVTRSGFDSAEEEVTVLAQETAIVQDFTIIPVLGRPSGLSSEAGDGQIDLAWMTPGASLPGEWVFYHDGTFENGYASTSGGAGLGTLFTPSGYPATITAVRFHVSSFGNPTDDIEVNVYADDGTTVLAGPFTMPGVSDDWVEVDIDDFTIESGGFLVATYNIGTSGPYISVDEDSYNGTLYFGNATGGWGEMGTAYGIFATGSHEALVSSGSSLTVTGGTSMIERPQANRNGSVGREFAMVSHPSNHEIKEFFLGPNGDQNTEAVLNTHPSNSANYRTTREDSLVGYNIYEVRSSGDTLISYNGPGDTTLTVTGLANYTEYCYAVKAIWDTDDFDTLESKYSAEVCEKPFKLGDVDFDNDVDVSDIPTIVDFALGTSSPTDDQFRGADVNGDRTINIQDIVMTVDIIFGTSSSRTIAFDPSAIAGVGLAHNDNSLDVNVSYNGSARGFQFTISYNPNQLTFGGPILKSYSDGMMLQHFDDGAGNYMVVAVDLNGNGLDMKDGAFVSLPISMTADVSTGADVVLTKVMISGPGGISIPVRDEGSTLKIEVLPMVYALHQNYPNPFNPVTEIRFDLPETAPVTLTVFNIMGQEVRTLVTEDLKAGFHSVSWNGLNDSGSPVSTGMYFYTISAGTYHSTKKMVLLK